MKYRSKLGTVINIPDGLNPRQVNQIKADADSGYGKRAQQTANKLGKKSGRQPKPPGAGEGQSLDGVVNPKTGVIDPGGAQEAVGGAENQDITTNFNLSQPQRITDQYGNVRIITRNPETNEVTIQDELGGTAKTFKDLATAAAQTFNGDVSRQNAERAAYGTLTRDYDRLENRELEDARQQLANRGIPFNPAEVGNRESKDPYQSVVQNVKNQYQGMRDNASQQAVLAGNQAYAVDASARDSFINAVLSGANTFGGSFGQYNNTVSTDSSQDTKDILQLSAEAYMQKYGIDAAKYQARLAAARNNSGGGGQMSGKPAGGGFEII